MDSREGSEFNRSVLLNGRKIRPTNKPTKKSSYSTAETPSVCSNLHSTNLCTLNDNLEKSQMTGLNMRPLVNSSRWCPTPEQLDVLEEIYRCGIRTPTAEKIQQIAANLRRFGEIEGKNVFYWFQNHKARERQKRRRLQLELSSEHQPSLVRKESGFSRRREFEVSEAQNRATSSNCSILLEESVSMHRAAGVLSENSREGWNWIQFEERELSEERERNTQTKHADLQLMNSALTTSITTSSPEALGIITDSKLSSACNLSNIPWRTPNNRETHMLHLFPNRSDDGSIFNKDSDEVAMPATDTSFTPNKFFEFLPLKN